MCQKISDGSDWMVITSRNLEKFHRLTECPLIGHWMMSGNLLGYGRRGYLCGGTYGGEKVLGHWKIGSYGYRLYSREVMKMRGAWIEKSLDHCTKLRLYAERNILRAVRWLDLCFRKIVDYGVLRGLKGRVLETT
jgi:hypothetical protein